MGKHELFEPGDGFNCYLNDVIAKGNARGIFGQVSLLLDIAQDPAESNRRRAAATDVLMLLDRIGNTVADHADLLPEPDADKDPRRAFRQAHPELFAGEDAQEEQAAQEEQVANG